MEDSFYITLPANSSQEFFPNNKNTHFYTKLEKRLNLKGGDWEVALTDLCYPNTWNNVSTNTIRVISTGTIVSDDKPRLADLSFPKELANTASSFSKLDSNADLVCNHVEDVEITGGRVDSIALLIKQINHSFKNKRSRHSFYMHHDPFSNKLALSVREGYLLFMSDELYTLCGFQPNPSLVTGFNISTRACDLKAYFHSIFVYTNVVERRIVGDARVPLLRSIPTRGDRHTQTHEKFLKRQYIKAANVDTDTIEIRLASELGEDINYRSGLVFVNLHFRRNKKLLPLTFSL